MSGQEPRRLIVYVDVIEFYGGPPPQDGERVVLVRGDGPSESEVMTWATVRHHPDDGRRWVYVDEREGSRRTRRRRPRASL